MELITAGARSACIGNETACQRCQSTAPMGQTENTQLLLAPQNANVLASLRKAMDAAALPYSESNGALALAANQARLTGPLAAWIASLPEATAADTRAVFVSGNMDGAGFPLAALMQAEPLASLRDRSVDEWLRDALDEDWLFSLFHPIIDAYTGVVFGCEALIRARNPQTQEIIGAGPIIDTSVRLNLEHVLDQRARRTAIRQAAALNLPDMRFFINFMPNTIYDPEICLRTTMETAQECGIEPGRLVFEVVETERIPDMKRLRVILDYYRSRGVGTAIDDFGAGYASLHYLTALQPDYVKIDRALVVQAALEDEARQSLHQIIGEAKAMGMIVIAEGIETEAQRQVCQEAGADYLQGFMFARPANPPQTVSWEPSELLRAA